MRIRAQKVNDCAFHEETAVATPKNKTGIPPHSRFIFRTKISPIKKRDNSETAKLNLTCMYYFITLIIYIIHNISAKLVF